MALSSGTRIGPYAILAPLGAGGMGEVYRARDSQLDRDVALKFLPAAFAQDDERVARFRREAKTLAALNHPHIAQIYGLEAVPAAPAEPAGAFALVMELVEGEDLAQRLTQGPVPVEDALVLARQIAEALDAAHTAGIAHRDLKPANIKVRVDGTVKVLDFGLAKALEANPANASGDHTPTITTPAMTEAGVILGTAAYMSPEQARGKVVDKRTDIWAFGCVLYEMLTGRRAFEGETVTDVLSAIVRAEPDWTRLPSAAPAPVRRLLERCLQKDPTKRLRDIGDAHHLLSAGDTMVLGTSLSAAPPWWRRALPVGIAAVVAATAAGALAWRLKPDPAQAVVQFSVYPPEDTVFEIGGRRGASATISPDGRTLAFTARDNTGKVQVWLRSIESLAAKPLAGTDGAAFPFWSPDSQHLAYFAQGKLHRIAVAGGPSQVLAAAPNSRGGAWSPAGGILFNARLGSGLLHVSSAGGSPSVITTPSNQESDHRFPSFLPDGRHFFYHDTLGNLGPGAVHIGALDGGDARPLLTDVDSGAVFSSSGHVIFTRRGVLLAQVFDPVSLELRGEPLPVGVHAWGRFQGELTFSVSDRGILAHCVGNSRFAESIQLVWVDRQGTTIEQLADTRLYQSVDLAPDQRRLAFHEDEGNGGDVWVMDLARGTSSRLTFDGPDRHTGAPAWSPDGTTIAYVTERNGTFALRAKAADGSGSESLLVESPNVMTGNVS